MSTKAIHHPYPKTDPYGALSMPVYNAVAFEFDDADEMSDAFCGRSEMPDYSRVGNPTVTYFEQKVAALTGAASVTALNSGMAAISGLLLTIASAGKNIVSSRHLFGNTYSFLTATLGRFDVEARLVDLTSDEAVRQAVDDSTCAIFLETLTNPQLEVADLKPLVEIARSRNIPLIADTTMIPFTEFDGAALGMDFQIVSSTKYLSGGATSLGGLIIDYGRFPKITDRIKHEMLFNLGSYMTPHAAYMQTLGLETLGVRYARQSSSALTLAKALRGVEGISDVNYNGLPDNPYHELATRQYGPTYGAMLTFNLPTADAYRKFINSLQLIKRATNLFDSRTLAIHPASTIYGNFTAEERRKMDVSDLTIRISVGLENPDDLLADIAQAVEKAVK